MANPTTFPGDVIVAGKVVAKGGFDFPPNIVGNSEMNPSDLVDTTNQLNLHNPPYSQLNGTASVTQTKVIHIALGTGIVKSFKAGSVVAPTGAGTVTVDLLKNGVSILDAAISLDSTTANFEVVAGDIATGEDDYVTDAVFSIAIVATAGGGSVGQGVFAFPSFEEEGFAS